jgi:hypothetical protein
MTTGLLIVNILPGGPAIIDPVREGFSPRKRPPVKVFFRKFNKFGSSPISLIKYFMKTSQGPGRKIRLRRKHRRDMDLHILSACFPQSPAGGGKRKLS